MVDWEEGPHDGWVEAMRKRSNALDFLVAASMLAAQSGIILDTPTPKVKGPKMPLTEGELEQLANLEGKAKKRFIKFLKAKYRGHK